MISEGDRLLEIPLSGWTLFSIMSSNY